MSDGAGVSDGRGAGGGEGTGDGRDIDGVSAAPREAEPPSRTVAQLLSDTAPAVFRLGGQFLAASETIARPVGLTAAWWQVLGAVLREPLPVSSIARAMGLTRQSVQRVADLLVERRLAAYEPNPAHRRAKLLTPTAEGRAAVARTTHGHQELAEDLCEALGGEAEFARVAEALRRLSEAMEALPVRR